MNTPLHFQNTESLTESVFQVELLIIQTLKAFCCSKYGVISGSDINNIRMLVMNFLNTHINGRFLLNSFESEVLIEVALMELKNVIDEQYIMNI